MIQGEFKLRPRYGEVDSMGYVYHANYVTYCHQARTELLRSMDINDSILEENNVMLPVISFDIQYLKPAHYDELLTIYTTISEMPLVKFGFDFEIRNEQQVTIARASSTVVFVNSQSRFPMGVPEFVEEPLKKRFAEVTKTMHT